MFLRRRFYLLLLAVALLTGIGYAYAPLYTAGRWLTLLLLLATVADIVLLWHKRAVTAERHLSSRFSNGDDNPVTISVQSSYPFPVRFEVIDELPFQFQQRDNTSHFSPFCSATSGDASLAKNSHPSLFTSLSVPPVGASIPSAMSSSSSPPALVSLSAVTAVLPRAMSASILPIRNSTSMS